MFIVWNFFGALFFLIIQQVDSDIISNRDTLAQQTISNLLIQSQNVF